MELQIITAFAIETNPKNQSGITTTYTKLQSYDSVLMKTNRTHGCVSCLRRPVPFLTRVHAAN